jgi:diadenosine tetraphosphate (Ap4A) HIT family hydrolase
VFVGGYEVTFLEKPLEIQQKPDLLLGGWRRGHVGFYNRNDTDAATKKSLCNALILQTHPALKSQQHVHSAMKGESSLAVATNGSVLALRDLYPVTGHLLILPIRHTPDLFSMTSDERVQALELIDTMRCEAQLEDPSILGFNVGVNCGVVAGQTVMHAHIHLIPRRAGDTADPRGGVRRVIPHRRRYQA